MKDELLPKDRGSMYWAVLDGEYYLAGSLERAEQLVQTHGSGHVEIVTTCCYITVHKPNMNHVPVKHLVRAGILKAHPWIRA